MLFILKIYFLNDTHCCSAVREGRLLRYWPRQEPELLLRIFVNWRSRHCVCVAVRIILEFLQTTYCWFLSSFCVCVCVCVCVPKYKVVQIWPGLFTLVYIQISPGHIWTTLYTHTIRNPCSYLPFEHILYFYNTQSGMAVSIATRYGLDGLGIESQCGWDFPHPSKRALRPTQPTVERVLGLSRG